MAKQPTTPNKGRTPQKNSGDKSPAKTFASEMAFDSRFEGRRWKDVEADLRAEYAKWLAERQLAGDDSTSWDRVKNEVREAWESALDVERVEADPMTGRWDERAPEYQRMWESRSGAAGGRWEDAEPAYKYAHTMAMDPLYLGRPWDDVAPGLEAGFPTWAASHGYRIAEGENLWERLRDTIRDAWGHVKHRRSV